MKYEVESELAQMQLKSLGFNPGAIDGLWGEKSQQAAVAWVRSKEPKESTGSRFDARTEANLDTLTPMTRQAAIRFLLAAAELLKPTKTLRAVMTSGRRTYAQQTALWNQGRTTPGPKVTNAQAGYSWHNFGTAWDITLFDGSEPVWDHPLYRKLAELGRDQGLDCGAFFQSFPDEPHYQIRNGLTMAEMRAMVDKGQPIP